MNNLDLWGKVEKTNPAYTKKANVKGNKITSIAPQYQMLNATEQFGSYGSKWGFKDIQLDYTLIEKGLIVFKGLFFYPSGEFPIINSIGLYKDNAQTKVDDDFAKKVETDALTKALSKLGFNADIFMGKFDDCRYLAEITEEFNQPELMSKTNLSKLRDMFNEIITEGSFCSEWQLNKLEDLHAVSFDNAVKYIKDQS